MAGEGHPPDPSSIILIYPPLSPHLPHPQAPLTLLVPGGCMLCLRNPPCAFRIPRVPPWTPGEDAPGQALQPLQCRHLAPLGLAGGGAGASYLWPVAHAGSMATEMLVAAAIPGLPPPPPHTLTQRIGGSAGSYTRVHPAWLHWSWGPGLAQGP